MKSRKIFCVVACFGFLVAIAPCMARAQGKETKLRGYVLDSACAFVKNLRKPVSEECAVACAKAGSPLVVLGRDGTIYWPISGETPAKGQNDRLMEFAGKSVIVTGKVFEKGGSRAVVIEKVEAAPGN